MIERVKDSDRKEAAQVYIKGLQMEIPKGYASFEETINHLKKVVTFVYKINRKIVGLITLAKRPDRDYKIDFICALKKREGIGTELIKKASAFCKKRKVKYLYSNVSAKDNRVLEFYRHAGFKKYGKYFATKNFMLFKIKAKPEWIETHLKNHYCVP